MFRPAFRCVLSLSLLCGAAHLFQVRRCLADDMDPTLARLRLETGSGLPAGCEPLAGNGLPRTYCPDNASWQALVSDLSGSLMSSVPVPAATTGYGGFSLVIENAITGIDGSARHFQLGTEGDDRAGAERCAGENGLGCNRFADDVLFWSQISLRKGLPFGFQLAINGGHLWSSSLWSLGAELQWAILEGLNRGAYQYLPDLAIRGTVKTVVGDPDFTLTVASAELVVSKPIGIDGTVTLTPIGSFQGGFLFADSGLIDLTPDIDAYDECRPDPSAATTGCTRVGPLPEGRLPGEDYNHTVTFDSIRAFRLRMSVGLQAQYELLLFAASFAFDLLEPGQLSDDIPESVGRQWTASFSAGIDL